jgi:hypothetical protein
VEKVWVFSMLHPKDANVSNWHLMGKRGIQKAAKS